MEKEGGEGGEEEVGGWVVEVPADALVVVTPSKLVERVGGREEEEEEEEEITFPGTEKSEKGGTPSSSSSSSPRQVGVLGSTVKVVEEVNGLVGSWAMLREAPGALVRYSEDLGPVLDGWLVGEVAGVLKGYVEGVEKRWVKGGGGGGKRKLTPGEIKARGVVADALEAVLGVTLFELSTVWVQDPCLLVDGREMGDKVLRPVQEMYGRVIAALLEGTGRKTSAGKGVVMSPPPPPTSPGPSSKDPSPRGGGKAPTSAFSRLSMAHKS